MGHCETAQLFAIYIFGQLSRQNKHEVRTNLDFFFFKSIHIRIILTLLKMNAIFHKNLMFTCYGVIYLIIK